MIFSIIIPSIDNFKYLKFTVDSIKKNSKFNHEIIVSLIEEFVTEEQNKYFIDKNIKVFFNKENKGICTSLNNGSKIATSKYLVLSDDDFFYLPGWDTNLILEIAKYSHNNFFISSTMIQNIKYVKKIYTKFSKRYPNHIYFNAGSSIEEFNEKQLMNSYKNLPFGDWNGTHHTPCVISKELFEKVGGFSEEFNPAAGSDPDFCMKLWNANVRVFKGVSSSRVYHFGSKTTRRGNIKMNDGHKTFLKKWKISIDFFVEYYLKRGTSFKGELSIKKNICYYIDLAFCKIKLFLNK